MKKIATITLAAITLATIAPATAATKLSPAAQAKVFQSCMTGLEMKKATDGLVPGLAREAAIKAGADYGLLPQWRIRGKKKAITDISVWTANAWKGDADVQACRRRAQFTK